MRFAHLDSGEITQHITFHGNFMVFLGCYKILTLQLQHLQVILVCLPQIAQVGTQSLFQLVALQACILNGNPGIVAFAAAVAVEQVELDVLSAVSFR